MAALTSNCNIIPIIDNFSWPEAEELPEDMRTVCHFNGVRWIHDYQDACVDKLERYDNGFKYMMSTSCRHYQNYIDCRFVSMVFLGHFFSRFMRGERDPINNNTNTNYRGNATPSTPSTASTSVRQNPLLYQRMHSNDSDKDTNNGNGSQTGGRVSD